MAGDDVQPSERVAVVGAGHVGLPTAAVLAHVGHRVVCAEHDAARFAALESGRLPIVEQGLAELVREGTSSGRLRFVRSAMEAVAGARFVFLCVPTPERRDGSADLSYMEAAVAEIRPGLTPGAIVVNKSTVPVGTARLVGTVTDRPDVAVVSNPEFLREGSAVHDSLHPDRVVVGSENRGAAATVAALFAFTGAPVVVTDPVSAETIKYAGNAFLATKLSFINALANLCESVEADVADVILGLGYDHRVGFEYVGPGPGWGGSCLPKDTSALIAMAESAGYDFALLRAAVAANEEQRARIVAKIVELASEGDTAGDLRGTLIGVWGLTFKAGTDDRRRSPALAIAQSLSARGATVLAYDPTVPAVTTAAAAPDLAGLSLCSTPYEAARGARVVAVLTEWGELAGLDFDKVADVMARPAVVDARNLLDPAVLRRSGFEYVGVGRR